jgi:hypothetical protein
MEETAFEWLVRCIRESGATVTFFDVKDGDVVIKDDVTEECLDLCACGEPLAFEGDTCVGGCG